MSYKKFRLTSSLLGLILLTGTVVDPALSAVRGVVEYKDFSNHQGKEVDRLNNSHQLIARSRGNMGRRLRNPKSPKRPKRPSPNFKPKTTSRVAPEARELARQMKANPNRYQRYHNLTHPKLPSTQQGWYYIEAPVNMGQARGKGQYRVVALVDNKGKVRKTYYSPNHYGTGSDAFRRATWIEFQ